jgi:hypothetical protein
VPLSPEQHDRLSGLDPGPGLERSEHRRFDRGGRTEVELAQALEPREAGLGDAPLAAAREAVLELGGEDLGQIDPVAEPVPHGRVGERSGLLADGGQAQRPAGVLDRERGCLLGHGRCHDAASPRSVS